MTYEELETRLVEWAQTQPAVRAIIVSGSRARGNPDRWSDLDLFIFTTDRERYLSDISWLSDLGEIWVTYLEDTDAHNPEWFVIYAGGYKMDAVLIQIEDGNVDLDTLLKPYANWHAITRGSYILFDRLGEPHHLPTVPFTPPVPPTAMEFVNVVSGLLVEATTTAKLIGRGDLWRAQHWFANDLRHHLLILIEWHAHGHDVWYTGRYINQWADPRILAALPQVFPQLERTRMQQALWALLDLCRMVGDEVALRFGYVYPIEAHQKITTLIGEIFTEGLL